MCVLKITDDCDNIVNCTNSESNIDINIPTLPLTVPYGLSFL